MERRVTSSEHPASVRFYNRPKVVKSYNRIIVALLRSGAPLGPMALLTVAGRTTGKPRSTPVALNPDGAGWRLTAAYGVGDWVKNLRAAGEATLTIRGRRVPVVVAELAPNEAAPLLKQTLANAGPTTRKLLAPYFDTPIDAPVQAWEVEAARHPMFQLTPAHHP